jgi:putrescine transport system ATP-binding protein
MGHFKAMTDGKTDGEASERSVGRVAAPSFAPWADPDARPLIRFETVSKSFAGVTAVDRLSLDIYPQEFFALLGPSGCGKTTLLRMLAGFETPDAGRVLLDGEDISSVPPHRRPVNMMFQSYALFPHLSVQGNIAFGLKQESLPKDEIAARVREMLALVRLEGLERRKPDQLSGGQRQRVALARALVKRPKVFLLDEPMAALDKKLRAETQFELMELQEKLGLTFIIVTHDQEEAMTVADRIAVMDRGKIVQVATPSDIYEQPGSRWVAEFIGDVNIVEGRVIGTQYGQTVIETPAMGTLRIAPARAIEPGAAVFVAIRPEKIRIAPDPAPHTNDNAVAGRVVDVGYLGDVSLYRVRLDAGFVMTAKAANATRLVERPIGAGDRVRLSFTPACAVVLRS